MKKLLSLLLAAVLALSLCVGGALAYEDVDPPLWQRWGYDSLEEYLADWDETEEEYAQEVADYIASRAEQDALIASFDPETHDFTPALWEYYGYESKAEMLEQWEIDEAGYIDAVDDELLSYERRDWTDAQWEAYWAEQELAEIETTKAALGLVYDVNIMVDGEVLDFTPASAPVIRNSCTMLRLGDLAQALKAEAIWDNDTGAVTMVRGGTTVEMTVDDMVLSFRTQGPDEEVSGGVFYLDSLPYVEGEEVYVPLRAVAEAMGYNVEWSDGFRTAVLVDVESAVAAFDAQYSILNALLSMGNNIDRSQTYAGDGKLDIAVKVPSLGAAAAFTGSISASMVSSGSAASGSVTFDMDQLMALLTLISAGDGSADSAEMAALSAAIKDGMELIYDLDNMRIYLKGKLFAMLFELDEAEDDVWYVMDLGELLDGMDAESIAALSEGTASLGQMLCTAALESGTDPVFLMQALGEITETFEPLSDSHFTGEGSVRSLTYAPEDFDGMTVTLNVTMDGGKAAALTGTFSFDDGYGTAISCDFDVTPLTAKVTGSVKAEETAQIDFTLTADSRLAPDATVVTAPPAGAKIVDLMELLYMPVSIVEEAMGAAVQPAE